MSETQVDRLARAPEPYDKAGEYGSGEGPVCPENCEGQPVTIPLSPPGGSDIPYRRPPTSPTKRVLRFTTIATCPTKHDVGCLLREPDGIVNLGLWLAFAFVAADAGPRGYLLDRKGQVVDAYSLAGLAQISVSAVNSTVERLIDMGVLEVCPYPHFLIELTNFIKDRCRRGEGLYVPSAHVYSAYLVWRGERGSTREQKVFVDGMKYLGFRYSRSRRLGGRQVRMFEGISLLRASQVTDRPSISDV